jgi:hypothetical protein
LKRVILDLGTVRQGRAVMPSEALNTQAPWQAWGLSDWNQKLFRYFFCASEDVVSPVTRLVVTAEELRSAVSDAGASLHEVRSAFRNVIRSRLHTVRRSLCTDALALEWQSGPAGIPPYFAHLVLTCLAASESGEEESTDGNFRVRLNQLLGRKKDRVDYPLAKLPKIWEMLRAWIRRARERGEPYRELILRRPHHLAIIGYSIELAFPSRKDRLELNRALSGAGLSVPLPVLPILGLIERKKGSFSERFREAYEDFRQGFLSKKEKLYRLPFWSAVEEAVSRAGLAPGESSGKMVRALLVLEREWGFSLNIFVDSPSLTKLPPWTRVEHAGDFSVGDFKHLLLSNEDEPEDRSAAHLLLSGGLKAAMPELRADDINQAVKEGLLLFVQDDQGIWVQTSTLPGNGELLSLIRSELVSRFTGYLVTAGANPLVSPSSLYSGWSELSGFSARHLLHPAFESTELEGIGCLQKTVSAPKIVVRGGVKGEQSWLGFRPCLPSIQVEGANGVSLCPIGNDESFDSAVNLIQDSQDANTWLIPAPPLLPQNLQGRFLLRAFAGSTLLGSRRIEFCTQVLGHEFSFPKDPSSWFSEGGRIDIGALDVSGVGPADVSADAEPESFIERTGGVHNVSGTVPTPHAVEALKEVIAALSLSRSKIAERDILHWTQAVLGIDDSLVWDVVRAWVEAGFIDCYIFRRWRMKAYFARRPRFIAFRYTGERTIRAVLQGLSTAALLRELERSAARESAAVFTKSARSPWLPMLSVLEVPSMHSLERISAGAGLLAPKWLRPIEECCVSVATVCSQELTRLRNHVHVGTWNWEQNRFAFGPNEAAGPVSLEWYRRHDAPDAFTVRHDPHPPWTTLSRTWAFLVSQLHRADRPYRPRGETVLQRVGKNPCHLPLSVGRFAAIVSGVAPGPVPVERTGAWEYQYTFPNARTGEQVLSALWPTQIAKGHLLRARWLGTLMRSAPAGDRKLVVLPDSIRKTLITRLPRTEAEPFVRPARIPSFLLAHLSALAKTLPTPAE